MAGGVSLSEGADPHAGARGEGQESDEDTPGVTSSSTLPSIGFRGNALSPSEFPLYVGQFLSTFPSVDATNLEVRHNGDLVLRRGDTPASSGEGPPLWSHRATGSIGGRANGGIGCVVQAFWETLGSKELEDIPVHLVIKNGRWTGMSASSFDPSVSQNACTTQSIPPFALPPIEPVAGCDQSGGTSPEEAGVFPRLSTRSPLWRTSMLAKSTLAKFYTFSVLN